MWLSLRAAEALRGGEAIPKLRKEIASPGKERRVKQ
jgi:hypothetical protein